MAETGQKPQIICKNNTWGELQILETKIFLKVDAEPTIVTIFNKIKEAVISISKDNSSHNFYVHFNIIKVLNDEKLPLILT